MTEAAEAIGLPESKLRELLHRHGIVPFNVDRRRLISAKALRALVDELQATADTSGELAA